MGVLKKVGRTERRHAKATASTHKTGWMRLYTILKALGWKRITYAIFSTPRAGKVRFDRHGKPLDVTHIHSKRLNNPNT